MPIIYYLIFVKLKTSRYDGRYKIDWTTQESF